jgi:predicted ATP-binding protein involved in virulence
MQIKHLTLAQFRGFEQAEFEFQSGMNLLVGINGAGKSSVLDALRIMLSYLLPRLELYKGRAIGFNANDIRLGSGALTNELHLDIADVQCDYLVHRPREQYVAEEVEGQVREQAFKAPHRDEVDPTVMRDIVKRLHQRKNKPLALYFSAHRSLFTRANPSRQRSSVGSAAAFADALTRRELRIAEFADWWLVQHVLSQESSQQTILATLEEAIQLFLEGCHNLRAVKDQKSATLLVDKDDRALDIEQLSDGERSVLGLVFDLAYRLSQANPGLPHPLQDGKAVVLIDELDLHLHPGWQRAITYKLTNTFPNCQFIATTHSPQIIGENSIANTIVLEPNEPPFNPEQSFGMDSNWLLETLMGTQKRNSQVDQKLEDISLLIEDEQYDQAQIWLDELRSELKDFPDLVKLQTRLDRMRLIGD